MTRAPAHSTVALHGWVHDVPTGTVDAVGPFPAPAARPQPLGSGVAQVAYAAARRSAQEFFGTGDYESLAEGMAFPELNALFSEPH
ncbi:hypothetical protein GCM10010121_082090 [Streptomyces brasiliensis]|uniref:Uncharacterized protein n=1 Tax=Streptomyces brasiliensis TaxID=1954 RepID=A0A917LDS3_9ACTN|nr:hypothetical protein GCM10010121_082090 [Streptomyces brasiliensis]